MMKKIGKKYNKALLLMSALVLLLVVTFFLSANTASINTESTENAKNTESAENTKSTENIKSATVSYSFDKNDKEATVFSGLINYGSENNVEVKYNNNYSYGVFIESIGGIKNGDGGKYWQYYVNDILGDVAADKKVLKEGDKAEWRFEEVDF